ncbi:MAG: hypothetical protein RIR60_1288 [Pseudomonadota bacterium]|jgi:hypothetical protein
MTKQAATKPAADKKVSNQRIALVIGGLALICYVVSMFLIWQK